MDLTARLARIYIKYLSMLTIVISLLKKLSSIDFYGGNCFREVEGERGEGGGGGEGGGPALYQEPK